MFWGKKKNADEERRPLPQAPPSARVRRDGVAPPPSARIPQTPSATAPAVGAASQMDAGAARKELPANIDRDELPRFLISEGHVSEDQLRHALQVQQETGQFFGEVLAEKGILDEQSLVTFLAKHCKIPHLSLLDYLIDKDVLALIPPDICWKYHLLPVDKLGRNLTVAMVNPLNRDAVEIVAKLCPDLRIKPILCAHNHFEVVAERLLGEPEEKDEQTWSQLPIDLSKAAAWVSDQQEESPRRERTSITLHSSDKVVFEQEPATPIIVPQQKMQADDAMSASSKREMRDIPDSDKLMDSVFGLRISDMKPMDAPVEEATQPMDVVPAEPMDNMESVMQQLTGVMMDSMRDTYDLLTRKIQFFEGLYPEDVAKIFSQGKVEEYDAGHILFKKGDSGDIMYVLLNGRVEIRDGYKRIASLQKGDIFGEMALASDDVRSADALTMTRTCLLQLSYDDIRNNMAPQVAIQLLTNIITTLSQRLRLSNDAGI